MREALLSPVGDCCTACAKPLWNLCSDKLKRCVAFVAFAFVV